MNIFSFAAVVTSVLFSVVLVRRATSTKMDSLNLCTLFICGCLAWWAFCDAFFYVAPDKQAAWFWHQLSALGWCGFVPVTAYYFLLMSSAAMKMKLPVKILFWLIAAALTLRNLHVRPTAMADDLVQSGSKLGWTFVQTGRSPWTWLFLVYLCLYLGGTLVYVLWWQRHEPEGCTQHFARDFVVLDAASVSVGFVSLFVLPYFSSYLPPMGFVATLIFLWGYWYELREYELLHVELALNPGSIFESCLDAMLITDANFKILYANNEACRLLGEKTVRGKRYLDYLTEESCSALQESWDSGLQRTLNACLTLTSGAPVICSMNRTDTRRKRLPIYILSLHDIGQLKQVQDQLEYLANYDELTGLPNRRRLGELLDTWAEKTENGGGDFELLFIDLDYFKKINDHYGHCAGDEALAAVSGAIREQMTEGDEAARLSGDEFVVLHRLTPEEDGAAAGERLRAALQAIDTTLFAPGIMLDAAVGTCRYSEVGNIREMLKTADQRMYRMKEICHLR